MLDDPLPDDGDDLDPLPDLALPSRPAIWPVFVTFIVTFASMIAGQVVVCGVAAVWLLANGVGGRDVADRMVQALYDPWPFMGSVLLSQLIFGAVCIGSVWLARESWSESLGLKPVVLPWYGWAAVVIGSWAPLHLATWAVEALQRVLGPDRTWEEVCARVTWATGPTLVVLFSAAPAIFEEIAFRGYMQRRLLKRWPPWAAILVTSILFGIIHLAPQAAVAAFIFGLWLGVIAWLTDSIWPGAVCHAFINAWGLSWPVGHALNLWTEEPPPAIALATGIVGLAGLCLTIWLLVRRRLCHG
jgi:membrane protease YdiL (CAAX protease family)